MTGGATQEADIVVIAAVANAATLVVTETEYVAQPSVTCVTKLASHDVRKDKETVIINDLDRSKQDVWA